MVLYIYTRTVEKRLESDTDIDTDKADKININGTAVSLEALSAFTVSP